MRRFLLLTIFCTFGWAAGPSFNIRDFGAQADGKMVRLDRCPGTVVRNSRASAGTGTFLETAPGEHVILEGNVLGAAKRPTAETKANYWTSEPATERLP